MLVWLLAMALHIVPPLMSVIIYEQLQKHTLKAKKRVALFLFFAISIIIAGYAVMWLRGWVYHEWLILELASVIGIVKRMVIPFVSAAALPFVFYFLRVVVYPSTFKFVSSVIISSFKFITSVLLPIVARLYKKATGFLYKEEDFDSKLLGQYAHCTLVLFTFLFIMFVFSPSYIAVGAQEVLRLSELAMVTLVIGVASLLLGCMVFLLRRNYKYFEGLTTGLLMLCFLNAFVLPFQAELLDGRGEFGRIADNPLPLIRNIAFFFVFAVLSTRFRKQLRFTAVPLLLIAVGFTASNIYTMNPWRVAEDNAMQTQEENYESTVSLSSELNVVVIVLDMLQGSIVERTFTEYPQFKESFDGFTVFSRAFSTFPGTHHSNVSIQSGGPYPSGVHTWQDLSIQSFSDSFISDMRDEGARVGLLGRIPRAAMQTEFLHVGGITKYKKWTVYTSASAASLARLTGYWIQSPISIIMPEKINDWEGTEYASVINRQVASMEDTEMLIDRLCVSGSQHKLLYFWSVATHTPVIFSKDGQIDASNQGWSGSSEQKFIDEAYFILMQMVRLLEVMKELGVYDNSLIIIMSDHGTYLASKAWNQHVAHVDDIADMDKTYGSFRPTYMYNAFMSIKPPDSHGQAVFTHDAAWIGDLRALINLYYQDFTNKPPIDIMESIRADNPEVRVIFPPDSYEERQLQGTTEFHEIVYITSLYDIPAVFAAHSGIDEK